MSIKLKCRSCGAEKKVVLRKRFDNQSFASVTGIPCKKCGRHTLKRV
jgi:uncharacterized Zn finger protein